MNEPMVPRLGEKATKILVACYRIPCS
jgi:hypothetical protein